MTAKQNLRDLDVKQIGTWLKSINLDRVLGIRFAEMQIDGEMLADGKGASVKDVLILFSFLFFCLFFLFFCVFGLVVVVVVGIKLLKVEPTGRGAQQYTPIANYSWHG